MQHERNTIVPLLLNGYQHCNHTFRYSIFCKNVLCILSVTVEGLYDATAISVNLSAAQSLILSVACLLFFPFYASPTSHS